jgi:hypothetical protein
VVTAAAATVCAVTASTPVTGTHTLLAQTVTLAHMATAVPVTTGETHCNATSVVCGAVVVAVVPAVEFALNRDV